MIHICFCLHDATGRYSKFTGTTMLSLLDNSSAPSDSITVHILHDNTLLPDNRDKFSYVAGRYNQRVKFYNVDELCADMIAEIIRLIPSVKTARVGIGAFFRLMIPKIFPSDIGKCIYLDSDIIVNMDIAELWRVELGEKILGVVSEMELGENVTRKAICIDGHVKFEDYFNSGVLLMNLNVLRGEEENIMRGIKFIGDNPQYKCFDQDVLNYCFSARTLKLPIRFNQMVYLCLKRKEIRIGNEIYHLATSKYPNLDMSDTFNRLWMSYFTRTPWFDAETIGRLYEGVRQVHNEHKQSLINISAMISGKTRAFFAMPEDIDGLKEIFSVRDDEEIIPLESDESLITLLNAMNVSRGKKIFFIMIRKFPFEVLTDAGFKQDEDFVDGKDFLSEEYGAPFDSYPLILSM